MIAKIKAVALDFGNPGDQFNLFLQFQVAKYFVQGISSIDLANGVFFLQHGSLTDHSVSYCYLIVLSVFEPRHEKTCFRGFRPGKTQTDLMS